MPMISVAKTKKWIVRADWKPPKTSRRNGYAAVIEKHLLGRCLSNHLLREIDLVCVYLARIFAGQAVHCLLIDIPGDHVPAAVDHTLSLPMPSIPPPDECLVRSGLEQGVEP